MRLCYFGHGHGRKHSHFVQAVQKLRTSHIQIAYDYYQRNEHNWLDLTTDKFRITYIYRIPAIDTESEEETNDIITTGILWTKTQFRPMWQQEAQYH